MGKPQADKDEQFASSIESIVSIDLSRGFAGFVASSFEGGWLWIWWLLRFWNGKEIRHLHHGLGSGINFDTSTLLAFRKIPILETARKKAQISHYLCDCICTPPAPSDQR